MFDEQKYLDSKLQTLAERPTSLSRERVLHIFGNVVIDNDNLLFEMNSCTREQLQEYDEKFNLLLESAISHAEHEHNLRISKENIKNSFLVSNNWMDESAVQNLIRLTSMNPGTAPDAHKFVPKFRR